jgi:cyclopropane-fatty-acyl-phospholipid synthase
MNRFSPGERKFDRVVSIEMFEHMRNYRELLARIASWLAPGGKLFVHIFCHSKVSYPFEARSENDWMAKYFFSGGLMPASDLLPRFDRDLRVEQKWEVSGTHYQRTSEAWLSRMDDGRAEIWPIIRAAYGADQARRWWVYWRVFFMSCAELFGYAGGREWLVAHYLFSSAGVASALGDD